jgi:hypothetical protein
MFRAATLVAAVGLVIGQASTVLCPMGVEASGGHEAASPSAPTHHHGPQLGGVENDNEHENRDRADCRVLLTCGTWAPGQVASAPALPASSETETRLTADLLAAFTTHPEPPPPRRI